MWTLFWLFKLMIKFSVLALWVMFLLFAITAWGLTAIVCLCARRRPWPFPDELNDTTARLVRWVM